MKAVVSTSGKGKNPFCGPGEMNLSEVIKMGKASTNDRTRTHEEKRLAAWKSRFVRPMSKVLVARYQGTPARNLGSGARLHHTARETTGGMRSMRFRARPRRD